MSDLHHLLSRAADFHRERATEYYLALTGQKPRLEAARIARLYPELFSRETLAYIAGLDEGEAPARLRAALLRQFSEYCLSDGLRELAEQLTNAEGETTIEFDDETLPYRAASGRLSAEPDADSRRRLGAAWLAGVESLNPLRRDLKQREAELLHDLGYRDAADYAERASGLRLEPLQLRLREFLPATAAIYASRLEQYSTVAGVPSARLDYADLNWVMAGRQYDGLFPEEQMLPALRRTLAGLNIDLDGLPGVTLDLEARPRKTPRAFCTSPEAPRDVRLVLTPRGGQEDYSTLFHEAGHMLFSSHMDPGLAWTYRHHGDSSVHETYAFLLQHLVESPAWWFEVMGVRRLDAVPAGAPPGTPALGDCLAFMRFDRLYMLRRYSAKLEYELGFETAGGLAGAGGAAARADEYARALTGATLFPYPAARFLDDFDRGFYVAQYLQAWIFEVQLRRLLERDFGEAWFTQRRAGGFLRDLWAQGMQYDIYEVAERLGRGGLNVDLIEEELLA